ncbi:DnaA N-terminal domain-containing protein [Rhodopseudomonas pseudopalustris]|uniref:DnaA N-terminal domain-containing protein n=1 Tax=Rhodopseudomonas pseudopalustris TaxID=1513892 RepID=A0A1H8VXD7_9BRAD|nr:DnaA N-terminal domain-containing protein [Rhodopseudomonas pseudopalustris]SEP19974.1 DnaA N-terminal domain-containing protein [Rhodopseudomonas pseudopalustris]
MAPVVDMDDARRKRDLARDFTALKLAALDQAAIDPRLTHLDFRHYYYLASAADRLTQVARRKQRIIADALGVTPRAVQISAERLSEFQYITIITKDGGSYTKGYQMVLVKANEVSPSENTKANPASPCAEKRRTRSPKKAKQNDEKGEAPFAPILPFNSLEIPSRARGPSSPDGLGLAGALLRQRLGDDVFRSWFGKVSLVSVVDGIVTLSAPTSFIRDRIISDHDQLLQSVWQAVDPNIVRVNVVTGGVR